MRSNVAAAVIIAAVIIAAGLVAHGGFYQLQGTGPETAFLVHRLTGKTWHITGSTAQLVNVAPAGIDQKEYRK